jgi:hypothetical protein
VFHRTAYELRSCRLYTGCRWVGLQITPPAPPARTYRPRFRQRLLFSMLHQRFIYIHLLSSHLPANADFSAVAHDRCLLSSSRTAWFDACLCRPTSRDLPSSTSVAPKRRSFSPSFTSHIGCPISNPSLFLTLILEPGPLPSTGITRLHQYYQPLRQPTVSGLSLAGLRLDFTIAHPMGLPVLRGLPLPCMPSPLPRRSHWVLSSLASPAVAAFPVT